MTTPTFEQKADRLWKAYPTNDQNKKEMFWQQYNALLNDQKSEIQKQLRKKQHKSKRYYPPLLLRFVALFLASLLEVFFVFLLFTIPSSAFAYVMMGILILLFTIIFVMLIANLLPYIAVTHSGIYMRYNLFYRPQYFAWASLARMELTEDLAATKTVYTLCMYTHSGKMYYTLGGYQLSKLAHHRFVKDVTKRGVRFSYDKADKYAHI